MDQNHEIILHQFIDNNKVDSIEVSKNSKGYTWTVKMYGRLDTQESTNTIMNRLYTTLIQLEDCYGGEKITKDFTKEPQ